jgi:3-oxoacyl-[acyl-carrier-protein] synthase-3
MDGSKVFMFSMNSVPKCVENLLNKAKKKINEIDLFIFHQASKIVNNNLQRKLNLNKNKFLENYKKFGNTVSSSIPLLIAKNIEKLKNKKIIMCGFGVGLSAGACIYEFK